MKIINLKSNNLKNISYNFTTLCSLGIGGLSGSGKSTFCMAIAQESFRRVVTLLPKSEYKFLFSEKLKSNPYCENISQIPLVFYMKKTGTSTNPRSTLGTYIGLFRKIRQRYAREYRTTSDFFSFNNSIMWCPKCKGRGYIGNIECKTCNGTRFKDEIKDYKLKLLGKYLSIIDINRMQISQISMITDELGFDTRDCNIIHNLINLKLSYLSLDRIMSTLSGGETIRVLLSEFMAVCSGALLILDEISTGLDKEALIDVLNELQKLGNNNQIWFVDHSDTVLEATENNIYFGPYSGDLGGTIVDKSPRPLPIIPLHSKSLSYENYILNDLKKRNLCINELKIPKNTLIAITGESGCGKSTLVEECILPSFSKYYKNINTIIIGQDKNQSITSKSTIATFLGIKKYIAKQGENLEKLSLEGVLEKCNKKSKIFAIINSLVELGIGYLTLDRKIQTLSTGEFQSIHLISYLQSIGDQECIVVLDEPSKGLSQNILNLLMKKIRHLQTTLPITIIIIEHNEFIIKCCDFVFDFGKRKNDIVTELYCKTINDWMKTRNHSKSNHILIKSSIPNKEFKLTKINDNVDYIFNHYDTIYRGGIIKNYSSTAQWIYKDLSTNKIEPIITIDFESTLYSKNTFLFEIASTINSILRFSNDDDIGLYDFYNQENLCKCCKGTGKVFSFDFEKVIINPDRPFWEGMLHPDIMKELKRYNFSKIKFLFKEIKKESNYLLDKPYSKMNNDERTSFLFGYWKNTFYETTKKTQRQWKGIIYLIFKYMRSSASPLKEIIKCSSSFITCPICHGRLLKTMQEINIEGMDILEILFSNLNFLKNKFNIPQIVEFSKIFNDKTTLNIDVSELPRNKQVHLKCLELFYGNFYGFTFVLKNSAPFYGQINYIIDKLTSNNNVILLDWDDISETTEDILSNLKKYYNISPNTYCYELIGINNIIIEINRVRKKEPCTYCHGSKVLREENIFTGVDISESPCMSCNQTGINEIGLNTIINNFPVSKWLSGILGNINSNIPEIISDLPICVKIRELNKHQLYAIINYLKDKKCLHMI